MDPVEFLLKKAEEMRALAGIAPELANDLQRMAEECLQAASPPGQVQERRRGARA
jgi:hypothetical protein